MELISFCARRGSCGCGYATGCALLSARLHNQWYAGVFVPSKMYVLPDSGLGEPTVGTMFPAPGIRNPELIEDLLDQTLWFLLPGRGN
jgi:hypothetical protein